MILPNSQAALILGIISIPLSLLGGIPGFICGVLSILFAVKAFNTYKKNSTLYSKKSYRNTKIGIICSIIGLILSIFFIIPAFVFFGKH